MRAAQIGAQNQGKPAEIVINAPATARMENPRISAYFLIFLKNKRDAQMLDMNLFYQRLNVVLTLFLQHYYIERFETWFH